eukprot:TRINITY_DN2027_c0_g1_i1.p1 TRINITY_DN2027_c0_g1~~TRINITY_DN2027_c0_g1_i1.p1  ORF type:complete len:299 (+),score=70.91 TRINITY_DN2027_c0_g1_i1:393-1289(+)
MEMEEEVAQAVEKVKKEWDQTFNQTQDHVKAIEKCGKSGKGTEEANSLPRLNGAAQDGLALLRSFQFRLDLLAPQLLTDQQVQSAQHMLKSWKEQYQSLHLSLRNANLQAKANIRKAAQEERELLLGGGEESTIRRRNLQTSAGMTSAAESITESLRRTRQLMVQEVERSSNTLMTFEESTNVLRKAESEYKGHRSLLTMTRNLLSTLYSQDVRSRLLLVALFLLFCTASLYVISARIGLLKLLRMLTSGVRAGSIRLEELGLGVAKREADDRLNHMQHHGNALPQVEVPHGHTHDEL